MHRSGVLYGWQVSYEQKERIWLGLGITFVILIVSSILFPTLTSAVEAGWFQSGNPVPAISAHSPSGVQALQINNANTTTIVPDSANPSAQGAPVTTTYSIYLPFISKAPTPISVYLPLIGKAPPATPTPTRTLTPTPTKTATPIPNPVANGGFEQGGAEWFAGLQIPYNAIPVGVILAAHGNELPASVSPHAGDWVAWLGGYEDSTTTLQSANPFTVPAGGSTLRYWLWIQSGETTCDSNNVDGAWVFFITGQQNQVDGYALCTANVTNGSWVKRDINLSNYVGQTGWLTFSARILGANSNWFIDDVQMGTLSGDSFTPYTR